jgi:hypothetical protein
VLLQRTSAQIKCYCNFLNIIPVNWSPYHHVRRRAVLFAHQVCPGVGVFLEHTNEMAIA